MTHKPFCVLLYYFLIVVFFLFLFQSIRDVGKFERHEVADMPENRGKNRYVNVLACKFFIYTILTCFDANIFFNSIIGTHKIFAYPTLNSENIFQMV